MILIQDILNHDDEVVSDVYPVAGDISRRSDVSDDLGERCDTALSSFLSYFSLGLGSRLKEDSFPPLSMMFISSLISFPSS